MQQNVAVALRPAGMIAGAPSFVTRRCPPPFTPRRGMHPFPVALFVASPCRAALSAPLCLAAPFLTPSTALRLVLPFVSSSPSSRRPRRPFVLSPPPSLLSHRPFVASPCAALSASLSPPPLSRRLNASPFGVFLFSFLFSTDAPFFYRCIEDLSLTDARGFIPLFCALPHRIPPRAASSRPPSHQIRMSSRHVTLW
jgi:hypothetical protein